MTNRELAEKLRCTSTVHDARPDCDACPFYDKQALPADMVGEYPEDWLCQCDVDRVSLAAADALENHETHIAALQREIEKLRAQLEMARKAADVAEVRWAEIKGFEGLYWVNQYGQVKNKNGDILKQGLKRSKYTDYKKVSLYKDGEYTRAYVHRLVAQAFVHNPAPEKFDMVNHKDEDGTNNIAENLEWCDRSYNVRCGSSPKKLSKAGKGRESEKRVPVIAKDKSGNIIGEYPSISFAAELFGCHISDITKVCRGDRKTAKGCCWEYARTDGGDDNA